MSDKTHEKELDALKADITKLREEVAGLVSAMMKSAEIQAEQSQAAADQKEGPAPGEEGPGVWRDLWHKLESSTTQSEKVIKDLSGEVERHPLVSIMAAFGLGYIIAKLWYRGTYNEDTIDAP